MFRFSCPEGVQVHEPSRKDSSMEGMGRRPAPTSGLNSDTRGDLTQNVPGVTLNPRSDLPRPPAIISYQ
jgi:hypothetical protein